jgi:hypothetical protein
MNNLPEMNWYNKINPMTMRSICRDVLPTGNAKRGRNKAATSRAKSTRVADLSNLYIRKWEAAATSRSFR